MVGKKKTLPTLRFDLCITMNARAWEFETQSFLKDLGDFWQALRALVQA